MARGTPKEVAKEAAEDLALEAERREVTPKEAAQVIRENVEKARTAPNVAPE